MGEVPAKDVPRHIARQLARNGLFVRGFVSLGDSVPVRVGPVWGTIIERRAPFRLLGVASVVATLTCPLGARRWRCLARRLGRPAGGFAHVRLPGAHGGQTGEADADQGEQPGFGYRLDADGVLPQGRLCQAGAAGQVEQH